MSANLTRRFLQLPSVIALTWTMLLSSHAQEAGPGVEEHFQSAQQAQQQGQFELAAREYQAVLHLQPGLPEAYVNLGLVYYAQGKFDESAKALAAAGKLRPGMPGVSLWLGIDYVKLNRPQQAIALLREAVHHNPSDKLGQSWLGTALWNAGQTDAALLQLRHAAALSPDDPDMLFALGEAYGKASSQDTEKLLQESSGTALSDLIYGDIYADEHEWTKAEGHFRRAIERDPHSIEARIKLADVFLQQARLPDAKKQFDDAVAMAPRSAAVLARSGELLLLMRLPAEGLSRIDAALNIDRSEALDALGFPIQERIGRSQAGTELLPLFKEATEMLEAETASSPARDVALAALYAELGDEDGALLAYKRIAPAQSSSGPSANLFAQAMTAFHRHDFDHAETALLRWLAANPADRNARYELALARRQISIAQVVRLIAVAPDSYHVHQMLGQIYASREEDDKATTEYLEVAASQPNLPGVHFWLGHLYWKHGYADRALAELTRELEIDPGHPEANGELGTVLVAEDRAAEAIPHLELAIRSKFDLWPAYPQLGRAYAMQKNYTRAEEILKRALSHDEDGATHYQLGLVLRAEGKTAQAAQVFAQVRAIKNEKVVASAANEGASLGAKQ